jgi:hypothetical protein
MPKSTAKDHTTTPDGSLTTPPGSPKIVTVNESPALRPTASQVGVCPGARVARR